MPLTLSAEMSLLTRDPETGIPLDEQQASAAVTAAVLVELCLWRRVVVADGRVVVTDATPTGTGLPDVVLAELAGRRRPRPLPRVLGDLRAEALDAARWELLAEGVLADRSYRVLGLFRVRHWAEVDPTARADLRERLDDAVSRHGTPDERTAALLALIDAAEPHESAFPYDLSQAQERDLRQRVADLAAGAWADPDVRDLLRNAVTVTLTARLSAGTRGGRGDDGGGGSDGGG